jgi:phosphoribosylanthranilate isomerase
MSRTYQKKNNRLPQVKICGLTCEKEALACADLGADAIGLIFYPKSPRYITPGRAKQITRVLPESVHTIGVFVNESFKTIMETVDTAQLKGVQLHGLETPYLVDSLRKENLLVIKGLFMNRAPFIYSASDYAASAFLVERGKGKLPGGNAETWDYPTAGAFGETHPFILAGGLTAENIVHAVRSSLPDAVDISSGVEISPGKKDLLKVASFLRKLERIELNQTRRRIFHG